MNDNQLNRAVEALDAMLPGTPPERVKPTRRFTGGSFFAVRATVIKHCKWMLPEMKTFIAEGRLDKVQRWLGFVQGALWAVGIGTIEDFKQMNMKQPEDGQQDS